MKECDEGRLHRLEFATRMAVMAFVRATCSRSGSAAKDWFDRAGKMLYWLEHNVLSVGDYTWACEAMKLSLPDCTEEDDPLRGGAAESREAPSLRVCIRVCNVGDGGRCGAGTKK